MSREPRPVPRQVIDLVDIELDKMAERTTTEDRWGIHELASWVYGLAWQEGAWAIEARVRREAQRNLDALRREMQVEHGLLTQQWEDLVDLLTKLSRVGAVLPAEVVSAADVLAKHIGWAP